MYRSGRCVVYIVHDFMKKVNGVWRKHDDFRRRGTQVSLSLPPVQRGYGRAKRKFHVFFRDPLDKSAASVYNMRIKAQMGNKYVREDPSESCRAVRGSGRALTEYIPGAVRLNRPFRGARMQRARPLQRTGMDRQKWRRVDEAPGRKAGVNRGGTTARLLSVLCPTWRDRERLFVCLANENNLPCRKMQ